MNPYPMNYYASASPSYNVGSAFQNSEEKGFHSILYKHYILFLNANGTTTSNPKTILVYNIETQQWTKTIPKGDSMMQEDYSNRICHIDQDKILRFGTCLPKPQEFGEPRPRDMQNNNNNNNMFNTNSNYVVYNPRGREMPYCEVLIVNERLNQGPSMASSDNQEELQAEWHEVKITDRQIPALKFASLNFWQNKLYVHGGKDSQQNINSELYIMNLASRNNQFSIDDHSKSFTQSKDGTFMRPRFGHFSVIYRENIYFYGGQDERYKPYYDIWTFNLHSLEWKEVKFRGLMPVPTIGSSLRLVGNTMVVLLGGENLATFNLNNHTWDRQIIQLQPVRKDSRFEIYQNTLIYGTAYDVSLDYSAVKDIQTQLEKDENSFRGSDQKLFREKSFTDVTFKVEGHHIAAHRAILATRCQHFNEMFLSSKDDTVIDVPEMKINIFNGLLEYIYCGDVEDLSEEIAAELLKLAEKCGVSGLREFGENFLIDKLAVENVVSITNLADAYGAINLQKACLLFITDNFAEVFNQQDIKKLSSSALFELFKKKLVK